jgi:hypothetical protein
MPTFKVTVLVEMDDVPLPNFPVVRRITTAAAQPVRAVQASGVGYTALPSSEMATIAVAMVQANQALQVALNGITANPILLNTTGMLIVVDAALVGVSVQNTSGNPAQITALLAGT